MKKNQINGISHNFLLWNSMAIFFLMAALSTEYRSIELKMAQNRERKSTEIHDFLDWDGFLRSAQGMCSSKSNFLVGIISLLIFTVSNIHIISE